MGRGNIHLANIYLKIHNKKPLMMDELRYLAEYDPECFVKTCKNVVYNIPEAKPIMEPPVPPASPEDTNRELTNRQRIERILENLKRLELEDFSTVGIDTEKVKGLLGNLYMELLFPHNDRDVFFGMPENGNANGSIFDKRA